MFKEAKAPKQPKEPKAQKEMKLVAPIAATYPPLTVLQTIEHLEGTKSRLEKEAIVRSAPREFFQGVKWCYTSLITFGVANIPLTPDDEAPRQDLISFQEFEVLLGKLERRELTGGNAAAEIEYIRRRTSKETWNGWYQRILSKDLRAGITATTTNKIIDEKNDLTDLKVVEFGCALADHVGTIAGIKKGKYKADDVYIEMKLNGIRLLSFVYPETKTCVHMSRNGKQNNNFHAIAEALATNADKFGFKEPFVLDGEAMSRSFNSLMTQVNRKKNVDTKDCTYHVFDVLPLSDFMVGKSSQKLHERQIMKVGVQRAIEELQITNVKVIKTHVVKLDADNADAMIEDLRQKAFDAGYEGLVFKNPDSFYYCTGKDSVDRNDGWIAYKPVIDMDLTITGWYEGEGSFVGTLGGLVCEGTYIDEETKEAKKVCVQVGGGFSLPQRRDIWLNPESVKGMIVEVRCDEVTKAKDSETWSLRFPRFRRFRGVEAGEKL